jgi:hypothetical protein
LAWWDLLVDAAVEGEWERWGCNWLRCDGGVEDAAVFHDVGVDDVLTWQRAVANLQMDMKGQVQGQYSIHVAVYSMHLPANTLRLTLTADMATWHMRISTKRNNCMA